MLFAFRTSVSTAVLVACMIMTAFVALKAGNYSTDAHSVVRQTGAVIKTLYDNGHDSKFGFADSRMVVRLNGSNDAGATSQPIDMERFIHLCGDAFGCSLTLGASGFRTSPMADAIVVGPSCRFFWNKSNRSWSLSQSCVVPYSSYQESSRHDILGFYNIYRHHSQSNAVGTDDSFVNGTDTDGGPQQILTFKDTCFLAESAPDTQSGQSRLMPDSPRKPGTGKGLFLIAGSPKWNEVGYPRQDWPADDPSRQCVLIVED